MSSQLSKGHQAAECTYHSLLSELAAQELHDPGKLVLGVNLRASTAGSARNEASVGRRARARRCRRRSRQKADLHFGLLEIRGATGSSEHNNDCGQRGVREGRWCAVRTQSSGERLHRALGAWETTQQTLAPFAGWPDSVMQQALLETAV